MKKELNFDEKEHRYWIQKDDNNVAVYTSVTTLLKEYVSDFDTEEVLDRITKKAADDPDHRYFALSKQEIKETWDLKSDIACLKGTIFHKVLEAHLVKEVDYLEGRRKTKPSNNPACIKNTSSTSIDLTKSWQGFLNFREQFPWRLYSSEEMFFLDDDEIAGTPDAIFHDPNNPGCYIVVDWKTSKPLVAQFKNVKWAKYYNHPALSHIPELNYWSYALQVNIYAYMINKCKGLKITEMVVLRFGEDCGDLYFEYYRMPDLQMDVKNLMFLRRQEKEKTLRNEKDEQDRK